MSVKSISLLSETNAYTDSGANDYYGEGIQGATYDVVRIFKIENSNGEDQFFQQIITLGSYGTIEDSDSVSPKFTEVKPIEKTITVFE